MELQDGSGHLGGNRPEEGAANDVGLVGAVCDHEDFLGRHNGANAHGVRLAGHIVGRIEQARIGVDGALRQRHAVRLLGELRRGFVEPDVAVVPQAQKLQAQSARLGDALLVSGARGSSVGAGAVRHMGASRVDIDMGEQVVLHEVTVALVVLRIEAAVLVQVEAGHVLEGQRAGLVVLNQAAVQADRGRAGGQTQHAIGVRGNITAYHARGSARHGLVIFGDDELHGKPLSWSR